MIRLIRLAVLRNVHLVDQLFDIERDLNTHLDIACGGARLCRPRNVGGMIKSLPHFLQMAFDCGLKRSLIHGRHLSFAWHHTRSLC